MTGSGSAGGAPGSEPTPTRLPRTAIPEDLTCRLCDPPVTFKAAIGFQGHTYHKHRVQYEPRESLPTEGLPLHWTSPAPIPQEPTELPPWAKLAIVRHELFGESYAEVAESMGKSGDTLAKYAKTPAGRKCIEQVAELSDVKMLTRLALESASAHIMMDWLAAFEWAKGARDYKMVHQMAKDVGLQPILQQMRSDADRAAGPTTLVLNLGAADLESVVAKTSSTLVIDAVVEDDDGQP